MLLLGSRLAYTKERRSALANTTKTTTCKKLTSDNTKRITFLIWQQVNSRAKHKFMQAQVKTKDQNRKTVGGQKQDLMKQKLNLKVKIDSS